MERERERERDRQKEKREKKVNKYPAETDDRQGRDRRRGRTKIKQSSLLSSDSLDRRR